LVDLGDNHPRTLGIESKPAHCDRRNFNGTVRIERRAMSDRCYRHLDLLIVALPGKNYSAGAMLLRLDLSSPALRFPQICVTNNETGMR
jgi:hypothetical protein